jgi:hypothetical protein
MRATRLLTGVRFRDFYGTGSGFHGIASCVTHFNVQNIPQQYPASGIRT